MNKRGQMNKIGALVLLAITIIVGAILLTGSAQNIGGVVNTISINTTFTAPANGTAYYFTNYKSFSDLVVTNSSDGSAIGAGNYTVTNNVVYNGQEAVQLVPSASANLRQKEWRVVATAQPLTYDDDAGSRTMTNLIIVLMALALAVVTIVYAVKMYQE